MQQIRQIVRHASRRLFAARLLDRTHWLALNGAAVFLLLVLADRLTALALPLVWVAVGLAAVVLLVAWIWTRQTKPGDLDVALLVDERLDLDERLSTALQCHGLDDSFARAAVEDGAQTATAPGVHQRINERFAITPPRRAWLAPLIVAAAIGCAFLPPRDIFARQAQADPPIDDRLLEIKYEIQEQNESLEALAQQLEDRVGVQAEGEGDEADIELPQGDTPLDDFRDELRRITSLQERLEAIRQSDEMKAMERMQDSLRRMKSPGDGPASELAQAMQRSDFEQAQREMEKLAEQLSSESMSQADQDALAQQMENLAKQLEQMAQEQQKKLEQALEQAGLDPSLANDPKALEQALQEASNLSEAQKQALQQMAQQNAAMQSKLNSMSQACRNAASACKSGNCQGAASAMKNMAGTMGQLSEMQQGAVLSEEALKHLQQMAMACGSCMGGDGSGMSDKIMIAQGPVQLPEWKEIWSEDLSAGRGGGGKPGVGAGGEMPRSQTRFRTKEEQLKTFLGEGPIVAQQLVQGQQIRGDSRVTLEQLAADISEGLEEGVSEDWVPREYHEAVKAYFSNLRAQGQTAAPTETDDDAADEKKAEPSESAETTDAG